MALARTWFVALSATWLAACGAGGPPGGPDAGADPYTPVQSAYDDLAAAPKCNPNDRTQNCVEMHPDALRVDDEAKWNWTNVRFNPDTKVLSFDLAAGTSLDPRIAVGKMLVRTGRGRPPVMARILKVQQDAQHVDLSMGPRLKTSEVFPKGRVRFRAPLDADPSTLSQHQSGLGTQQAPLTIGKIGPEDCARNVFNQTLTSADTNGKATGTVKLDLTKCKFRLGAYVDGVIEWGDEGPKAEVVLKGTLEASLHTKFVANLSATYNQEKKIWSSATPIVFTVGGVVLTLEVDVFAGYSLSGKADLTVEQGFDATGEITTGVGWKYYRDPQLYTIYDRSYSFSSYGPLVTFDGNVKALAFVKPRVSLEAYGLVGAAAAVKVFAKGEITAHSSTSTSGGSGTGSVTAQVCTDLYAGFTPSVALVLDPDWLLDEPLEYEYELDTYSSLIKADACVNANSTYPSDCDRSISECCTDSQCADDPYGFDVHCTKGGATSGGKYRYSCHADRPPDFCENVSACNDGKGNTLDSCRNHLCVNEPLNLLATAEDLGPLAGLADSSTAVTVPETCNTDSDCDDRRVATRDTCKKTVTLGGPALAGTCQNTPITP